MTPPAIPTPRQQEACSPGEGQQRARVSPLEGRIAELQAQITAMEACVVALVAELTTLEKAIRHLRRYREQVQQRKGQRHE